MRRVLFVIAAAAALTGCEIKRQSIEPQEKRSGVIAKFEYLGTGLALFKVEDADAVCYVVAGTNGAGAVDCLPPKAEKR